MQYTVQVGELFLERSDHECRDRQGFMDHIQVTQFRVTTTRHIQPVFSDNPQYFRISSEELESNS